MGEFLLLPVSNPVFTVWTTYDPVIAIIDGGAGLAGGGRRTVLK